MATARSIIKIIGWEKDIGDKVTLLIRRKWKEMEVPVTLAETPEKLER